MKRIICFWGFVLPLAFVLLGIHGCSKVKDEFAKELTRGLPAIEKARSWFKDNWGNAGASMTRTSTWENDKNFLINNYSNLIPDWNAAVVHLRGDTTFTEVPVILRDTLEFKILSPDSTQLYWNNLHSS